MSTSEINSMSELYFNPEVTGHFLVEPILFYGRQVNRLYAELPAQGKVEEVVNRIFIAAITVATIPLAALAFTVSLVGLAIKFCCYVPPNAPAPNSDPTQSKPSTGGATKPEEEGGKDPKLNEKPKNPIKVTVTPIDAAVDSSLKDVNGLSDALNKLFEDIKSLSTDKTDAFAANIVKFEQKYPNLDKDSGAAKSLRFIKDNFEKLKGIKAGLFINKPKNDNQPRINDQGIIAVPGDGNCLFHSILLGLGLMEEQLKARGTWRADIATHRDLRQAAVAWMRNNHKNDDILKNHIVKAIEDYKDNQRDNLKLEIDFLVATLKMLEDEGLQLTDQYLSGVESLEILQQQENIVLFAPEGYFKLVENAGFFGSAAEMYAISQMYQVNVNVSRMFDNILVEGFDPEINPVRYPLPSLHLVHYGDHFNAVIDLA